MDYVVTCDGAPIGVVFIPTLTGLPHAELRPTAAYESVRDHAVQAAMRLARMPSPHPYEGDFAEAFARTWTGGRLAIADMTGDEISVSSVMIIDGRIPRVIVDARPDMARIEAFIHTIGRGGGGRRRPAA